MKLAETDENRAFRQSEEMTNEISEESKEDISLGEFQICGICLSPNSLTSFEEKKSLVQLFQVISNIDVKDGSKLAYKNGICEKCISKLEDISSFITLSLRNNHRLECAVVKNEPVRNERYSYLLENEWREENSTDISKEMNKNRNGNIRLHEIKEEHRGIDIKEHIVEKNASQNISESHSGNLPEDQLPHLSISKQESQTGEKPFKCDYCEKSFKQKASLRLHLKTHTGKKLFRCTYCDRVFLRKDRLQTHLLTHTGEKPFKCDHCERTFIQKQSLKFHLQIHTDKTVFKCTHCDKTFFLKHHLQSHLLIHSGEKTFKCECCDKSFLRKDYLQAHLKTHTGKRLFKCGSCDKSFIRKRQLRLHSLTHTGEKSFKCDMCEKSYYQKHCLTRHLQTHNEEGPL